MFYRENGQFKTSYRADQQIFPITQDRIAIGLILAIAFFVVPLLATEYAFKAILIPFLILSLAAIGVNVLVGYCGQISLGSGAFMAVGAYAAYNTFVRIDGMPVILAILSGGFFATLVGIFFGIPSLRVRGLYLAIATLAAQFFCDWAFLRISWFTNNSSSGSVAVSNLTAFGIRVDGHSRHGRGGCRDWHSPGLRQAVCICGEQLHYWCCGSTVGLCLSGFVGARCVLG